MAIWIGMDEAGYGPNLGPLAVAATVWQTCDERMRIADGGSRHGTAGPQLDLYTALRSAVVREANTEDCVAIADSKTLYKAGNGLRQLERAVHATLFAMLQAAPSWTALLTALVADPQAHRQRLPWQADFNCRLPIDATADEVTMLGERLRKVCETAAIAPVIMRARLVFPAEFNELTERYGSKGVALSHVTIGLLCEVMDRFPVADATSPERSVLVVCDKHGGRNRYGPLLQHHFPDDWVEMLGEGRAESRYRWGPAESHVEVAFRTGGEAFLPTALASMTAKYLRELAMRALNEFWCARQPALRPTAGYPVDAWRFKQDIAVAQQSLSIDDRILWRDR